MRDAAAWVDRRRHYPGEAYRGDATATLTGRRYIYGEKCRKCLKQLASLACHITVMHARRYPPMTEFEVPNNRLRKWLRRPAEWRPPKLSSFARTQPQAARTVSRNLATSAFRRLLSPDSICAADSTCEEAEPVSPAPRSTSAMLAETWWVPCAACCTLREISCVAAPCSSTAAAMVEEISDRRSIVPEISRIALTDCCVALWMPEICWLISPVAFAVCSASAFTSEATTANPLPASPARAASIVALSARRLVWPAMVLISSTTSPIRVAALDSSLTRSVVVRAWPTASPAIRADSCTWRPISVTDEAISSVEEATDCTLVVASSDAAATAVASCLDLSAVEVSAPAELSSWLDAEDTVLTISPITASNARVMVSTRRPRSIFASASRAA